MGDFTPQMPPFLERDRPIRQKSGLLKIPYTGYFYYLTPLSPTSHPTAHPTGWPKPRLHAGFQIRCAIRARLPAILRGKLFIYLIPPSPSGEGLKFG